MKKLYNKSELWFSIIWIIAYVVLFSIADGLSEKTGYMKSITALVGILLSTIIIIFVMQKSGTSKHCLYTITSKMMSQHSIGQVLYSLCHLYLFSFSKPLPRFCQLTHGATAHLLRILFSDCSSKSVIHTGSCCMALTIPYSL